MNHEPHKLNESQRSFGIVAIVGTVIYAIAVVCGCVAISL